MINLRANPPGAHTKAYDKTSGLLNAWALCRMFRSIAAAQLVVTQST